MFLVHFMKYVTWTNDTLSLWVPTGCHFKRTPESLATIWLTSELWSWSATTISGLVKLEKHLIKKNMTIKWHLCEPLIHYLKWIFRDGVKCTDNEFVRVDQRSDFNQIGLKLLAYALSFILKFFVVFCVIIHVF